MIDGVRPTPYLDLQRSADATNPHGRGYYIKSGFLRRIEPGMIDAVVEHLGGTAPMNSLIIFALAGGAIGRIKPDATAFLHREANHSLIIQGFWDKPSDADASTQWARGTWRAVEAMTDGFYVNEVSNEDPERRIRANYGANYDRLVKLKNKYDPANLFRMNANIKPSV
jgi:hypothetical protein